MTGAGSADRIQASLADRGVRMVACAFVDLAGVTRTKVVPVERFAKAVDHGVGISYVSTVFAVNDDIAASPGFDTPCGDMRLRPDPDAVVVLAGRPRLAWAPVDQHTQDLEPMSACPRSTLRRVVALGAARDLSFRTAFEVEFTLFDAEGNPAHRGPGYGARALFEAEEFALDFVAALGSEGVEVEQLHPEYSIGQYEVSVAPRDPIRAADEYVLLRATAVRVARDHGYRVSFAPAALPDIVGNGCHVHLSGWSQERNLMSAGSAPDQLSGAGEHLVAGMLEHLPALMAVLAPSVGSYQRLRPGHWSGAFTCWGLENREAALRLVRGTAGTRDHAANVELKPVDGAANPYLALAVILAAGLDGMQRELRLPTPLSVDPATLSDDDRAARGIRRLPTDLPTAIDAMRGSELIRTTLGDPLFHAFLAVRDLEWKTYAHSDQEALIEAHRWRYG